jgi:hypothetical protein
MATILGSTVLLAADAVSVLNLFTGPEWGIFDNNGVQVVGQDVNNIINIISGLGNGNFLELDYRAHFAISNYPQEGGAFQSYNKVQQPYETAVTITAGGTAANRIQLLNQVQAIIGTTNLYKVNMPEGSLVGLNPVAYTFPRKHDHGLGLLMVTIIFQQVRPAGDPKFSTTANPNTTGASAPTTGGPAPITNPTTGFVASTSAISLGVMSALAPVAGLAFSVTAGIAPVLPSL